MTFSIAAFCKDTGMLGCAISSSSISVTSRCAFAKSGVGIALTQNITNPDLAPLALKLIQDDMAIDEVMAKLKQNDNNYQWRQLGILNTKGDIQMFSGQHTLDIHAQYQGNHCFAMGNLLANTDVPKKMVEFFQESKQLDFPNRLYGALNAGLQAGGELGSEHSAGILVYEKQNWPCVDLRVDWHEKPIAELKKVLDEYLPQMQAYITRALDPVHSESYGVPGDE